MYTVKQNWKTCHRCKKKLSISLHNVVIVLENDDLSLIKHGIVLILAGNSEHVAHGCRKTFFFVGKKISDF